MGSLDKTAKCFTVRNTEAIIVNDENEHILHLRGISIEELVQLADIVFRNGYDLLIRREVDDE